MQFTHLRSMAALLQPKKVVAEGHASNFEGLKEIVHEAIADLEGKLGSSGALEEMMKRSGLIHHDTIKDKDGYTILHRLQVRTQQYKEEVQHAMDELELMFMGLEEGLNEGLAAGETVEYGNKTYKSLGSIKGDKLEKGMKILGVARRHDNFFEVLGFTDHSEQYSEKPKFNSVKELYSHEGVTSLAELNKEQDNRPYGHNNYMVCKDLKDGDVFTAYLYKGRWSVGTGADPLSMVRIEEV